MSVAAARMAETRTGKQTHLYLNNGQLFLGATINTNYNKKVTNNKNINIINKIILTLATQYNIMYHAGNMECSHKFAKIRLSQLFGKTGESGRNNLLNTLG